MVDLRLRFLFPIYSAAVLFLTCAVSLGASFSTVVIDAGHGGHDAGGIPTNIIPEKGVALDTARRVQAYLNEAGVKTVMTRNSDVFVTLDGRVSIANAQKRSIFVSIHYNSAPRRGANGIETFYSGPAGKALARLIHKRVMTTTPGENRGVKPAKFYVLRKTKSPAVLVECGFLTNPQDAARASSKEYRDRLARQIAKAIIEYKNQ